MAKRTAKRAQSFDSYDEFEGAPTRRSSSSRGQKYPQTVKSEGNVTHIGFRARVQPKTYGQEFYMQQLDECDITLCNGPAGCGKTLLAVNHGLKLLLDNKVEKIVVVKPIIEAGFEEIGALPGEFEEKTMPYFSAILDHFEDLIGPAMTKKLIDAEKIVFIPTAYMRGRDIKHAFILIDEAQNLTIEGIRLLMTRISKGSKMVLQGDSAQVDLPKQHKSGFSSAISRIRGKSPAIGVVELTMADTQRHPLMNVIINALYGD